MKISPHLHVLPMALAIGFLVPSCALPTHDAWKVIKDNGFLTYLSIEMGKQPIPPGLSASPPSATSVAATQPTVTTPWRATPSRYWDTNPAKPVVSPPKVTKPVPPQVAVAPKPALRPPAPKPAAVASAPPVITQPAPTPVPAAANKPELQKKPEPKIAAAPPAPSPPTEKPAPNKSTAPAPTASVPAPQPAASPVELPYGEIIAGRPGFVHSPYAMKNQIVDVTGLRTGQEVKCPFTGKLFRVPPGEQAAAKPAEEQK